MGRIIAVDIENTNVFVSSLQKAQQIGRARLCSVKQKKNRPMTRPIQPPNSRQLSLRGSAPSIPGASHEGQTILGCIACYSLIQRRYSVGLDNIGVSPP